MRITRSVAVLAAAGSVVLAVAGSGQAAVRQPGPSGPAAATTPAVATGPAAATSPAAATATTENYGQYSRMFARSAGQYVTNGKVAGQWAWRPINATTSDISWGDPAHWPPKSAEHFIRRGSWVELDGYSPGQGLPVTEVQRVSAERIGDANCTHMVPIPSDGHRQHYVKWTIPSTGYCLDADGTITSTIDGSVVHFRHLQQWGPPIPCHNAYFSGQRCISQHERWWDDNHRTYAKYIDRTAYIARGKGMAFGIRATVPINWTTQGRAYWTW